MARLFNESFEARTLLRFNAIGANTALTTTTPLDGTASLLTDSNGNAEILLNGSFTELYVGFYNRFTFQTSNTSGMFEFRDDTTQICTIGMNSAGQITAWRGNFSTLLGTGSVILSQNTIYHIQVHVVISATVGVVQVKIDDVLDLNLSSQNTGSANLTRARVGSASSINTNAQRFDSIVVNSTTGSVDNTWPGILHFTRLAPAGVGFYVNNWSRNTGSTNWEQVDEVPPDDDTTYLFTTTANLYESFSMSDFTTAGANIRALITAAVAKKDSGTVKLAVGIRDNDNSTNYWGANSDLGTAYGVVEERRTVDPSTSASWTIAGANATEALIDSTA